MILKVSVWIGIRLGGNDGEMAIGGRGLVGCAGGWVALALSIGDGSGAGATKF